MLKRGGGVGDDYDDDDDDGYDENGKSLTEHGRVTRADVRGR